MVRPASSRARPAADSARRVTVPGRARRARPSLPQTTRVDTRPDGNEAPAPSPPPRSEPRQRWRLTFARTADADAEMAAGREYFAQWESVLAESGLAVATTDAGRFRFALAAPLPARTAGRAELADLWLTERLAAWQVRAALEAVLPLGHELVGLEDVWLGAPALAGRVAAADYLVRLSGAVDARAISSAADRLLAADRLPRERTKGGAVKSYDLRPLIISITTAEESAPDGDGGGVIVRVRTRIHPELGSGRPEEVVAALADELGVPLEARGNGPRAARSCRRLGRLSQRVSAAASARPGRN